MNKPYAEACDRNRDPILAALRDLFEESRAVLEIGSGTGQHAAWFAARLPHLEWYPSDRAPELPGIRAWTEDAGLANLHPPRELDVTAQIWPAPIVDAVFSSNTAHIMHLPEVRCMFAGVGALLPGNGLFALYGPFNYSGRYTSDSNARFDDMLKTRDPEMGLRNVEDLDAMARAANMIRRHDFEMPANNRLLCWRRIVSD
jgi:SAM-dependent methyltransferase